MIDIIVTIVIALIVVFVLLVGFKGMQNMKVYREYFDGCKYEYKVYIYIYSDRSSYYEVGPLYSNYLYTNAEELLSYSPDVKITKKHITLEGSTSYIIPQSDISGVRMDSRELEEGNIKTTGGKN